MRRWIVAAAVLSAAALTSAAVVSGRHGVGSRAHGDPPARSLTVRPTVRSTVRSTIAAPQVDPCVHNRLAELVVVSLARQRVWLCARQRTFASFAVTTGRRTHGDSTPRGTFAVQARTRDTVLDPSSGGDFHVKYWIPFKWGMFGFHDAPWQKIPFGSPRYVTSGSQGCVHMRTADIARLFGWVRLGTVVSVRSH